MDAPVPGLATAVVPSPTELPVGVKLLVLLSSTSPVTLARLVSVSPSTTLRPSR